MDNEAQSVFANTKDALLGVSALQVNFVESDEMHQLELFANPETESLYSCARASMFSIWYKFPISEDVAPEGASLTIEVYFSVPGVSSPLIYYHVADYEGAQLGRGCFGNR